MPKRRCDKGNWTHPAHRVRASVPACRLLAKKMVVLDPRGVINYGKPKTTCFFRSNWTAASSEQEAGNCAKAFIYWLVQVERYTFRAEEYQPLSCATCAATVVMYVGLCRLASLQVCLDIQLVMHSSGVDLEGICLVNTRQWCLRSPRHYY